MRTGPDLVAGTIVFRGRLDESDAVDLWRGRARIEVRWQIRWLALGLLGFITLLTIAASAVWLFRRPPDLPPPLIPAAMMIAIWAYLAFGLPAAVDRRARRYYRATIDNNLETEVRISEDRIDCKSEILEMSLGWGLVKLVVDAPVGIILCNAANNLIVWLPSRLLGDPGAREGVLRHAQIHGIPIRRLG
ncbi:hypothetical protein EP7_005553 (plasmid) [Isosphaeraceae bacterium EP7]